MDRIQLLALSVSLRKESYNSAAIKAMGLMSPESVEVRVYKDFGESSVV